jgi:putative endonuclease
MHHVYLLKSSQGNHFYVGYTSDIDRRLAEHHQGKVYYTKRYRPWRLVYFETFFDEAQAKERERKLKQHGSSYKGLLKRLGYK